MIENTGKKTHYLIVSLYFIQYINTYFTGHEKVQRLSKFRIGSLLIHECEFELN